MALGCWEGGVNRGSAYVPVDIGVRSGEDEAGTGGDDTPSTRISPEGELIGCPPADD